MRIYAMAYTRAVAIDKLKEQSKPLLEHICKICICENKTGDYSGWKREISTFIRNASRIKVTKYGRFKSDIYESELFGTFGDEKIDARINLELFVSTNKDYKRFEITDEVVDRQFQAQNEIRKRFTPLLVSCKDDALDKELTQSIVSEIFDKITQINSSEGMTMLKKIYSTHKINAADDDENTFSNTIGVDEEEAELGNQLDDMADNIEDIQDTVEDVTEDSVDIEVSNNIANHYIAECEKCHNIFISAVVASDQDLNSVHGICPVCEEESDQDLKWVIREVDSEDEEEVETEQV